MKFTEETGHKYIGNIEQAYLVYASDEQVRLGAASGGAVSALLLHLLEAKQINGAVVTRIKCSNKGIECEVILAKDRQDILSARTSKYIDVPLVRKTRELLRTFSGKVAVVALPCHVAVLRRLMEKDRQLARHIKYIIALFCGHSCQDYLLSAVLKKKGIDPAQIADFAFRKGSWRGNMQGRLHNGREFSFPFWHFSYYHNVNFFCLGRCLRCHDHTGYEADFSIGDAWLREMKANPIKHSIVISRNNHATEILEKMLCENKLNGRRIDAETVFRAQKRALIYHYNVTARSKVGKWYGVSIKDTVKEKVRWNDWLAAHIIMVNYKLSQNPRSRDWIFKIPRPIIFVYFLFLKFLQNF